MLETTTGVVPEQSDRSNKTHIMLLNNASFDEYIYVTDSRQSSAFQRKDPKVGPCCRAEIDPFRADNEFAAKTTELLR